jgi:hypothetical protein
VRMQYAFSMILTLPPLPPVIDFARDSRYAVSALPTP